MVLRRYNLILLKNSKNLDLSRKSHQLLKCPIKNEIEVLVQSCHIVESQGKKTTVERLPSSGTSHTSNTKAKVSCAVFALEVFWPT